MTADRPLILSLFPGLDLLGLAFEQEWSECCIVRGPDVIWGSLHDVRTFHPPARVFDGIIGGPPCQAFSALARLNRAQGREPRFGNLIPEFERVVAEAQPGWWLMENVPEAPVPTVVGYDTHVLLLNNRWVPDEATGLGAVQHRRRRFTFGTHDGRRLQVAVALFEAPLAVRPLHAGHDATPSERAAGATVCSGNGFDSGSAYYERQALVADRRPVPVRRGGSGKLKRTLVNSVCAAHAGSRDHGNPIVRYTIADAAELQGLPRDALAHSPCTQQGKLQLLADGVPLFLGRAAAAAVRRAMEGSG